MAWLLSAAFNYIVGKEDCEEDNLKKEREELKQVTIDAAVKDNYMSNMTDPRMDYWFVFDQNNNIYYLLVDRDEWNSADTYSPLTGGTRVFSRAPTETLLKLAFSDLLENSDVQRNETATCSFKHKPSAAMAANVKRVEKGETAAVPVYKSNRYAIIAVIFHDDALKCNVDEAHKFVGDLNGREKSFVSANRQYVVRVSANSEKVVELRRKIEKNRDCWIEVSCELPEIGYSAHPRVFTDSSEEVVRKLKIAARQMGHDAEKFVKHKK